MFLRLLTSPPTLLSSILLCFIFLVSSPLLQLCCPLFSFSCCSIFFLSVPLLSSPPPASISLIHSFLLLYLSYLLPSSLLSSPLWADKVLPMSLFSLLNSNPSTSKCSTFKLSKIIGPTEIAKRVAVINHTLSCY